MKSELKELSWDEAVELGSPYNYVLAVTIDKKNKPNIIGLGWWTYVSWNPKMMIISIGKERYSHECLEYCKEFVLCFPSKELKNGAWLCGEKSGRDIDKFIEAGFKTVSSKIVKPPIIEGSTVAYECKVVDKLEAGDHTVYVGEIVAIHGTPEKPSHLYSIHYEKLIDLAFNNIRS
jgi:flavin reductase (DIM6/NTAB) family NADH-FMN oxidoreductase RutF